MKYKDMVDVAEDARIKAICDALESGQRTGVILEDDADKIERYKQKIFARCKTSLIMSRTPGLIKGVVTLVFDCYVHGTIQ